MLRFAKTVAGLAALGLLIYGMLLPSTAEGRWLQCLWGATMLGGFAVWPIRRQSVPGVRGGTQNLAMVMLIGFTMLTVQLLRLQVVKAEAIASYSVSDEAGNVTSNVRPVLKGMRVQRGTIYDAQGEVLAKNVVTQGGYSHRTYPLADKYDIRAFSHVLGYVSTIYGLSGIESSYDDYLSGAKGNSWENTKNGVFNRPQQGNDLQLTINAQLQQRAFDALEGRVGSVVVLDAKTGAVRALVSNPGFDPRELTRDTSPDADDNVQNQKMIAYFAQLLGDENRPLINRTTQGLYPPGSTFKTVTAVAALNDASVGKPDDIECPEEFVPENGSQPVVNAVKNEAEYIRNQYGPDYGLDAVYAFSCNTAFAQYGLRLEADGRGLLLKQAERFHVYPPDRAPDEADFTDLPTQVSTLYASGDWNRPALVADTAFGQGELQVTPLQMGMITQAIANRGVMMKPYLVQSIRDPQQNLLSEAKPREIGEPLSPQVAGRMFQSMRAVIERGWPGAAAAGVPGFTIGGKSGTAENPQGAPHAWFIEIGPLEDPKYAVAVMVEHGGEGTSVGGRLAGQVMQAALEINP